jgi:hypothetical protein
MEIQIKSPASVPAGTYEATFEGIEVKTSKRDGAAYWRWTFATRDGIVVSGVSSTNTGPSSKPYRWLKGLLGRPPQADERLDSGALVGSPCRLVLEANDDGFSNVADVLPVRLSDAAVAAYAAQADETDLDDLPI